MDPLPAAGGRQMDRVHYEDEPAGRPCAVEFSMSLNGRK